MGEGDMLVAMTGILSGTGMICFFIHSVKTAIVNRGRKSNQVLLDEVKALRTEIQELKRQNNELFLALDDQAAHRRLAQGSEAAPISQYLGR